MNVLPGSLLLKDTFREIKGSLSRFFAILAIVALGVGFFVGVKATSPDMKVTADKYFNNTRLMDIHIQSTMGFNSDDVTAIEAQKEFNNVMFSYTADALMNIDNSNVVVRIYSLPQTKDGKGQTLNNPVLISGRLPNKSGECVVEENNYEKPYKFKLGETIALNSDAGGTPLSNYVKKNNYTIVGFVNSPLYISFERGNSAIGNGNVSCYIMILPEDFSYSAYTDVYLTSDSLSNLSAFSTGYGVKLQSLVKTLQNLGTSRGTARYKQNISDGQTQINNAKTKLANINNSLSNAKSQLDASQAKINSAESELTINQNNYNNGLSTFNQADAQLEAAKSQAGVGGQTVSQLQSDLSAVQARLGSIPPTDPSYPALQQQAGVLTQLITQQQQINTQQANLAASKASLDSASASLANSQAQLASAQKEYDTSGLI